MRYPNIYNHYNFGNLYKKIAKTIILATLPIIFCYIVATVMVNYQTASINQKIAKVDLIRQGLKNE